MQYLQMSKEELIKCKKIYGIVTILVFLLVTGVDTFFATHQYMLKGKYALAFLIILSIHPLLYSVITCIQIWLAYDTVCLDEEDTNSYEQRLEETKRKQQSIEKAMEKQKYYNIIDRLRDRRAR